MGRYLNSKTLAVHLVVFVAAAVTVTAQGRAQDHEAVADGFTRGAADAPITVIEFGDLGCSACALFARQTFPVIDAEYIQTGQVRWTFVPIVLGTFRHSKYGSQAALCADEQGAFFAMHDRLYQDQRRWQRMRRPDGAFRDYAQDLGLDAERFEQCYGRDETADRADELSRYVRRLRIRGTPAFLIGDRWVYGAFRPEDFREFLTEAPPR